VAAGRPVERPTAGDHPQPGVVQVAVDRGRGEVVLRVPAHLDDAEHGGPAVLPLDVDLVAGDHVAQGVEDARCPSPVDVPGDDGGRRPRRAPGQGERETDEDGGQRGPAAWCHHRGRSTTSTAVLPSPVSTGPTGTRPTWLYVVVPCPGPPVPAVPRGAPAAG